MSGTELILEIKPNWVVLRVKEYLGLKDSQFHEEFQNAYEPVQVFDSLPRLQKNYPFIPGQGLPVLRCTIRDLSPKAVGNRQRLRG